MLLLFTDVNNGNSVAVNPQHIVCVFTSKDETTSIEATIINMLNGNVAVTEEYTEVVGRIQSELK
jgi:uncharacterized protein YlzI (FlbEa/FlbD family)